MIKRLRLKFICINMAIVTVMLLVIFGMVLQSTGKNMEKQSLRMMQMVSDNPIQKAPPGKPSEMIRLPFFAVSVTPTGEITVISSGLVDLSDEASLQDTVRLAWEAKQPSGILREQKLRYSRNETPFGTRIVFVDISSEFATMRSLVRTCSAIGLASFSLFFFISVLLARWAVRPVETAWNQQRQFVADASHELKTPLTVILTNAELLQTSGDEDPERRQCTESILTMSKQMRGLVEGLLELARVDNGTAKMAFGELDFSELVSEGLLPFEPVYFEKGLLLESNLQQGLRVKGSSAHLRQVLDILLDNGAKYALPGSTVMVRLYRQGGQCLLSVANPGEAICKEDLKNIFKRFYRVDKVRSMSGSYGLGLSIAEQIVQQHGGKIWAESAEGINTFYVQLGLL